MKVWSVDYEYQMVGSKLVEADTAEEAKRIIEERFEKEGIGDPYNDIQSGDYTVDEPRLEEDDEDD